MRKIFEIQILGPSGGLKSDHLHKAILDQLSAGTDWADRQIAFLEKA